MRHAPYGTEIHSNQIKSEKGKYDYRIYSLTSDVLLGENMYTKKSLIGRPQISERSERY